jgi:hypothetical protein
MSNYYDIDCYATNFFYPKNHNGNTIHSYTNVYNRGSESIALFPIMMFRLNDLYDFRQYSPYNRAGEEELPYLYFRVEKTRAIVQIHLGLR